ncbi:MAG TPA: nucleotide exchange factor GrpE [Patescibacteria group bacterium]|nr:nucleotide exchange factor GrpE [Patescibacteria group bacterium]
MVKQEKKLGAEKNLVELKSRVEELTNLWKRALADYQNLERRFEREKADFVQHANNNLILKQLSVLDHLERAQGHLQDEGLAMAIKEFKRVLAEEGLMEIEVLGKQFDPQEMEAVETVEGEEENEAVEVVSKGYRLKNKVIRVAKVKVSKRHQ